MKEAEGGDFSATDDGCWSNMLEVGVAGVQGVESLFYTNLT